MSNRIERTNDKKTVEKHQKILKDLLQKPENKICADCKKRDPRWASANLGIFICLRCSGIHRSLGVHISKCRSVDLDTWTPEHIENMQRWGNGRANKYWEHALPPGNVPDDSKMESFIRSKYEYKKYVRPGPMPEPETLDDGASGQTPQQHQPQTTHAPQHNVAGSNQFAAAHQQNAPQFNQQSDPFGGFAAPSQSDNWGNFSAPTVQPVKASNNAPQVPQSQPAQQQQQNHWSQKNDIMSLFSAPPPSNVAQPVSNNFGAFNQSSNTFNTGAPQGNGFNQPPVNQNLGHQGFQQGFSSQGFQQTAPQNFQNPQGFQQAGQNGFQLGGQSGFQQPNQFQQAGQNNFQQNQNSFASPSGFQQNGFNQPQQAPQNFGQFGNNNAFSQFSSFTAQPQQSQNNNSFGAFQTNGPNYQANPTTGGFQKSGSNQNFQAFGQANAIPPSTVPQSASGWGGFN